MRGLAVFLGALACSLAPPAAAQQPPEAFTQARKGHCAACHQLPAGVGPGSRSDLGPKLEGERMRALGKARLRELLDDPATANPDTVMPPFGRHRILDAKEIDALVEFLHALP